MFLMMSSPYEELSNTTLDVLERFSKQILIINESIPKLLKSSSFNSDPNFMDFISHFSKGRYYHFQCEGYMKCLVLTKCYSPITINYWLNALVYPAASYFAQALEAVDQIEPAPGLPVDHEFNILLNKLETFENISMKLMDFVKMYTL